MSNRIKIRVLDCSITYLIQSKTTTIIKRLVVKESMIKVFQASVIKRKVKTIAQVRKVVQILSRPMENVMVTVTCKWIREWARIDHQAIVVFLPLMTKMMEAKKFLRLRAVTRLRSQQTAFQKELQANLVSMSTKLKVKSINWSNLKSRSNSVTTPRHSTE